jgi:hypothetical protein
MRRQHRYREDGGSPREYGRRSRPRIEVENECGAFFIELPRLPAP